jgi:WD40 repeat protein
MADIYNMSDVFLSYSRRDAEFCKQVFTDLKARDKEVWADFEDIPKAADWWEEIKAGIDAADAFVFIISPDSVRSDVCRDEVEHAVAQNKRILPILYREITEDEDKAKVHPSINSHNWIFARKDQDDYDTFFKTLLESIETDLEHNRLMTRFLVRAKEWEANNRNHSYLLTGKDFEDANTWFNGAINKEPHPSDLHSEYIEASRQFKAKTQRRLLTLVSVGLVGAIVLSIFAVFMAIDASRARDAANIARVQAEQAAIRASSLALASSASEALFNNDPDLALTLSLEAANLAGDQPQVYASVADAVYSNGTQKLLDVGDEFLFSVALSYGGETVAHGSNNGTLCLHDVASNSSIICLEGHEARVTNLAFTNDNAFLVSTDGNGQLFWWDVDPDSDNFGTALDSFAYSNDAGETAFIDSVAIQEPPNEPQRVFFGTGDGQVGVWLPTHDDEIEFWDSPHESAIQAMTINNQNTRLLTGDQNGILAHWYLRDEAYFEYTELPSSIIALDFNSGGQEALVGYFNDSVEIINLIDYSIVGTYNRHEEPVRDVYFGDGDETFISISWDRSIYEWDVISGRIIRAFYGHSGGINDLAVDAESQTFVTAGYDTDVRLWSLSSFQERMLTNNHGIWQLELSQDGSMMVSSHDDGDVIVWSMPERERIITFQGYGEAAVWATISPDGRYVATLFEDELVTVRDLETGEWMWLSELDGANSRSRPFQVHFTHDGSKLLVVLPNALYIADTETGEILDEWVYDDRALLSALVMPDDETVLLGFNRTQNNLWLYDLETGEQIREFQGHDDGVLTIDISADSTQIVTGSYDNLVRVWDVETGNPTRVFSGHSNSINDVAFNGDGSVVASVSGDRSVRLWSIETGFELFRYVGHAERVNAVAYTPDFSNFITGSMDNTIITWSLPSTLDDLLTWVNNNRYIRELTCNEAILYLDSDCDPLAQTISQETGADGQDADMAEESDEVEDAETTPEADNADSA